MTIEYPESLLLEADRVVKERENQYAPPLLNHGRIAERWTRRLRDRKKLVKGAYVDPEDVAWMMVDVKQARDAEIGKHDNLTDTAGYASCLDRIDQHMKLLGYLEGRNAFRTMSYLDFVALMERLSDGEGETQSPSG